MIEGAPQVVAGGPGPWFNCDVVDLDADGHPDILATQQQFKDKNGTVARAPASFVFSRASGSGVAVQALK